MKTIPMSKFEIGKDYPYTLITNSRPKESHLLGYGDEIVGRYFVSIILFPDIQPEERICSFILTGSAKEYIFTCVYNNFPKEV